MPRLQTCTGTREGSRQPHGHRHPGGTHGGHRVPCTAADGAPGQEAGLSLLAARLTETQARISRGGSGGPRSQVTLRGKESQGRSQRTDHGVRHLPARASQIWVGKHDPLREDTMLTSGRKGRHVRVKLEGSPQCLPGASVSKKLALLWGIPGHSPQAMLLQAQSPRTLIRERGPACRLLSLPRVTGGLNASLLTSGEPPC
ncbi:hypothetical protein TREES_T100020689 [Tupaia chinensis]|uniref:Uncharacterized protein n=1 Tax=Tupaia chinensis TaxID=246437 RepID=L9KM37_TUPCH|nr:hypothetical protein TREES_T100020689 [Tupaia chinensis]